MDIAALLHHPQEVGFWLERVRHTWSSGKTGRALGKRTREAQPAASGARAAARRDSAHPMR